MINNLTNKEILAAVAAFLQGYNETREPKDRWTYELEETREGHCFLNIIREDPEWRSTATAFFVEELFEFSTKTFGFHLFCVSAQRGVLSFYTSLNTANDPV